MRLRSLSERRSTLFPSSGAEPDGSDEYRVKLYKVASRQAQEERERLREEWDARNRGRD